MSSRGVPEVLMKKVDEYVDSLAPQIQPRISSELEVFQEKAIASLESQVVDAFRSLFNRDDKQSRSVDDGVPDSYGRKALPFANEIAQLTRGFGKIADEAGDDLADIFDLTEGSGGTQSRSRGGNDSPRDGARGFLSAAINAVQDHLDDRGNKGSGGGGGFELDGLLGVISNTVKEASRNPEEKARAISPEIRDLVGAKLREQHTSIAEQFTRIALDHIKRWLRGNTSASDLGDGVRGEVEDKVKDLVKGFGSFFSDKDSNRDREGSRSIGGGDDRDRANDEDESRGGFSKVISDKLSTGLAKVHREVRLEFRKVLGAIEKQLFELLPDVFQRPLEKILGGNPFDAQMDRDAASSRADRGFGDDIKAKLVGKIRDLVRRVQETLRASVLGVVNGGHRRFERQSWVFVQGIVENKVQKYLPKVKITVPDDIGNEGVSVGTPTGGKVDQGSGHHDGRPSEKPYGQEAYHDRPSQQSYGNQDRPSQYANDRPTQNASHERPGQYEPIHQTNQGQYGHSGYEGSQNRPSHGQDYGHNQDRPSQGQDYGYQQGHSQYQSGPQYSGQSQYDRPSEYQGGAGHSYDRPSQHQYGQDPGPGGNHYGENPRY